MNTKKIPDNEYCTFEKISWFFQVITGKYRQKILYTVESFSELSISHTQNIFSTQIDGILVDIDDCIAPAYGEILPENIKKIEELLKC